MIVSGLFNKILWGLVMHMGVKDFFYFPFIIFIDDDGGRVFGLNLAG